jgi:hypothetical protein
VPQPTDSRTRPRRRRALRAAVAVTALGGLAAYALVQYETGSGAPPHCTVADRDGGGAPYTLQPQQAANAAVIGAVGTTRNLPERAVTIAIATAMQESSLRNIDYGDRDSLGLFQQRPSMGWGTEEQIMDPVYASGQFYDHLVLVPGYLELPLTVAAQEVQRSAFPDEYAKHEPPASLLAAALTGRQPAALSCSTGAVQPPPGDPELIGDRLLRDFGGTVAPRSEGSAVVVPVPVSGDGERGWKLAHWAVAHAMELGIASVGHDGRRWEADRPKDGWQTVDGDGSGDDHGGGRDAGASSGLLVLTLVR